MPRDLLALRNAAPDTGGYGQRPEYGHSTRRSDEFERGQPVRGNSRGGSRDGPAGQDFGTGAQGAYRAPTMQARPSQEGARGYPATVQASRQMSVASGAGQSLAQMRGLHNNSNARQQPVSRGPTGASLNVPSAAMRAPGGSPPSPRDFVPSFAHNGRDPEPYRGPDAAGRQDSVSSYYYGAAEPSYNDAPRVQRFNAPQSAYAGDVSPRGTTPVPTALYDLPMQREPSARDRAQAPAMRQITAPAVAAPRVQQTRPPQRQQQQQRPAMAARQTSEGQYSEKDSSYYDEGENKLRKKDRPPIKKGQVPMEEMGEFFGEVADLQSGLREIDSQISHISSLHLRLLDVANSDDASAQALKTSLTQSTKSTRAFMNDVKARIQSLEQGNANLRAMIPLGQSAHNLTLADVEVRNTQVVALKERFKEAIQRYGEVERDARAKNRARMERQVRIVNPALSKDEATQVVRDAEDGGETAVFSQALMQQGARSFAARGALREVESRAAALARIEQTLVELAQLFNDMSTLVEAQDVQIVDIEQKAVSAEQDMGHGLESTKKAVVSARSARKWRWVCLGIFLVIVIIVVLVVLFQVILPMIRKNQNNSANSAPANKPTVASSAALLTADVPSSTRHSSLTASPSNRSSSSSSAWSSPSPTSTWSSSGSGSGSGSDYGSGSGSDYGSGGDGGSGGGSSNTSNGGDGNGGGWSSSSSSGSSGGGRGGDGWSSSSSDGARRTKTMPASSPSSYARRMR